MFCMPVNRPPLFLLLPTAFVALCKVLHNVANSFLSAANCPRENRPPPFFLLPTAFVASCKVLRNVANSFLSAANCPRDPEEKATPLAVACGR